MFKCFNQLQWDAPKARPYIVTCNSDCFGRCSSFMQPWVGDLLRLISFGSASGWFGLACPSHCSASAPYLACFFITGFALVSSPRLSCAAGSTSIPGLRDLPPLPQCSALTGFRPHLYAFRRICMSPQAALPLLIEAVRASARAVRGLAENLERAAAADERGPSSGPERVTELSTDTLDWDLVTELLEAERGQGSGGA